MSNGFGAGFLTLGLLAALGGPAALLLVIAVAATLLRRRRGRVPGLLRSAATALLVVVLGLAGVGVLALADESAIGAAVVVGVVYVPLAAAGFRARRWADGWREPLASAALAWSGPYLLGGVTFVGTNVVVTQAFDLAPGEARALGVGWTAVLVAGVVATAGAWGLAAHAAALTAGHRPE